MTAHSHAPRPPWSPAATAAHIAAIEGAHAELVARLEALADEAEAGGDHPTAARIRDAIEPAIEPQERP